MKGIEINPVRLGNRTIGVNLRGRESEFPPTEKVCIGRRELRFPTITNTHNLNLTQQ